MLCFIALVASLHLGSPGYHNRKGQWEWENDYNVRPSDRNLYVPSSLDRIQKVQVPGTIEEYCYWFFCCSMRCVQMKQLSTACRRTLHSSLHFSANAMKCQVCLPHHLLYLSYGTTLRTISILIDSFNFYKEFTWIGTVHNIVHEHVHSVEHVQILLYLSIIIFDAIKELHHLFVCLFFTNSPRVRVSSIQPKNDS